MKLFESRKFQVWGIVTILYTVSLYLLPQSALQSIFVEAWTSYLFFTGGILGINVAGKAVGMHHERQSRE